MSSLALVATWLLFLQVQADIESEIIAEAKAYKSKDIAAAQQRVERCDELLKSCLKTKDSAGALKARGELRAAKESLSKIKSRRIEGYIENARLKVQQREEAAARQREAAAIRDEREERQRLDAERNAKLRAKAMEERRKSGPVFIENAVVALNVINIPELNFSVTNATNDTVEAFDIEAECFNAFDEPVNDMLGSNVFSATCQDAMRPNANKVMSVQMSLHRGTGKAFVRVTRVKLGSGEVWTMSRDKAKETPGAIFEAKRPE